MGPGSPIYFDMEAYTRTATATSATLAFLEAWTENLHTLGYISGVYSSSASNPRSSRTGRQRLHPARRHLVRQLERRRQHRRPLRPGQRLDAAPAHPPVPAAATTRPMAG